MVNYVALVLLAVGGTLIGILGYEVRRAPEPIPVEFEIVRTCRGPWFRRNTEYVLRNRDTRELLYQNFNGRRTLVTSGTRLRRLCRPADSAAQ